MKYLLLVSVLIVNVANADIVIYPAKGQSADQQKTDEGACFVWAKDESDFDPLSSEAVNDTPDAKKTRGKIARNAAIGAALGGKDGAKKGAAVGAVRQRRSNKKAEAAADNQAAEKEVEIAAKRAQFDKANAACLEGRGYAVK